jgi:hypothetical protein
MIKLLDNPNLAEHMEPATIKLSHAMGTGRVAHR